MLLMESDAGNKLMTCPVCNLARRTCKRDTKSSIPT